jgi:ADP-heptose:LPS heptosyltransferase
VSASTVIRAPNHLGDVVMALPAIRAAGGADILALGWLVPLLEMAREAEPVAAGIGDILPLTRGGRGMLRAARVLRSRGYERGILFPPSMSSALLLAAGGVRERRGFPTDARRLLLTDAVDPMPEGTHRAAGYMRLVGRDAPQVRPPLAVGVPPRQRERWRGIAGTGDGDTVIGISPGSNAAARRWGGDRYAELVRRLAGKGLRVIVFGGPGERELIERVAGDYALPVGGTPDLPLLAAGLADCSILVTNDSGPMHLAAAVGTRTIALIGPSNPALTGPLGDHHVLLHARGLPCQPCGRNECPRTGPGTRLAVAEDECMRWISVGEVEAAVLHALTREPARGG